VWGPSPNTTLSGGILTVVAQIDLIEETFVAADPVLVAAAVHEPRFTAELWPDLRLAVFMDRRNEGIRWTATGALTGSCEVWLEAYGDGVLVHTYLRCDVADAAGAVVTPSPRDAMREIRARARHAKRVLWGVKDRLEAGRAPGGPAVRAAAGMG
jgi:hypothetical protein